GTAKAATGTSALDADAIRRPDSAAARITDPTTKTPSVAVLVYTIRPRMFATVAPQRLGWNNAWNNWKPVLSGTPAMRDVPAIAMLAARPATVTTSVTTSAGTPGVQDRHG